MIRNGLRSAVIFGSAYRVLIASPISHRVAHSREPARVVVFIQPLAIFEWCGVSEMGKECVWTFKGSGNRGEVVTGEAGGRKCRRREDGLSGRDQAPVGVASRERIFVGTDGCHYYDFCFSSGKERILDSNKNRLDSDDLAG